MPPPDHHDVPARPAPVVLVGEDSDTVRALLVLELEAAGYAVLEAADGHAVLDLAARCAPDVVLLDVEMPVLDGWKTLTALKQGPATAEIPVLFLTGRTGTADVVRALERGAHDYLRKPPEPAELLARVAAAVRLKQLQDALRRQSTELDRLSRTDALTGLHNRRHVEEHLLAHESGSRRYGYALAILVVDVDHFKAVNDRSGHAAGDAVLRQVAELLRSTVRFEDLVGRWGGEEFVVIAPHTDVPAARVLAERLRTAVAAGTAGVTVSIGGSAAVASSAAALLATADANLYAAKDAGRDRTAVTAPADAHITAPSCDGGASG